MTEKREKPQKAEDESKKPDTKPAPSVQELGRNELEALRQMLQRKFHQ